MRQVGSVKGVIHVDGQPDRLFENILTEEDLDMAKDELLELIGEGDARVSVSMDMSDKGFGTGYGAHVTVSLTSDQTKRRLDRAAGHAQDLTVEYLAQAFAEAKDLFKAHGLEVQK